MDNSGQLRIGLLFLSVLALLPVSASAARRITADQLQQLLNSAIAAHKTDDSIAEQLGDIELAARLNESSLQQLLSASPGSKTEQMLRAIADASVFLDPPASEIPARPVPDVAAQKFMLSQTIHYVARTLHTLPDFLATRQTEHYAGYMQAGLKFRVRAQAPVAFRDGRETDDPSLAAGQKNTASSKASAKRDHKSRLPAAPDLGLTSWGEFGPILEIVLVDAARGRLKWSHWEQRESKPVAVFQFIVDRPNSHYSVAFKDQTLGEPVGGSYGSRNGEGVSKGQVKEDGTQPARGAVGYHGYLTIDPDTGTILRITIQADLPRDNPVHKADMMVEYGPVQIGPELHICPTRSVSIFFSDTLLQSSPIAAVVHAVEQQLNDVRFVDYRRFGSEATLVMNAEDAKPDQPSQPPASAQEAANTPASAITPVPVAAESTPAQPTPATETAAVIPPRAPNPEESDEEILVRDVNGLPGMSGAPSTAASGSEADSNFTLKVTTRLVDLGLVAIDKHNKPIADLKPEDIEIYDNGRRQQVRAFHHASTNVAPARPSDPTDIFTNEAAPAQAEDNSDLLLLLMDESHLPYLDLNRARVEIDRFLKSAHPDARVALYALNEHGFRTILDVTTDHALLQARLAAWIPSAASVSHAQDLENRNKQQFDTVRNPEDLNSVNGNTIQAPDYINSVDPQLRQMGDNPLRYALGSMIALARHFAPVAGHKSLIWISGDSVLEDWSDQAVSKEKGETQSQQALLRTREALNEAHMALYAVDASAVQGNAIDASLANAEVGLNPVATANSVPGGAHLPRDTGGRIKEQMLENTRAIQSSVRLLAESTGGRAVNKGSDLKATLDSIEQESEALYEIGFNPDTPADNKFHTLQVKISGRKDVKLRYRNGYLYNEEAATTKQRFQDAVWSPQDARGIQLSVRAVPAEDSATGHSTVKLRIGFPGLALRQNADRWTDDLYIFIAQRDDAAQKAEVSGDTLRLSLKQSSYESGMPAGIPYQHAVEPKSKLGSVRIIVVDSNSGRMGSVTIPSSTLKP